MEGSMKKILLSIFTSLLLISNAFSSQTCSGKISAISISGSGGVYATITSSTANLSDVVFCGLNSTEGNYSGESCKGLLSLLLSGSALGKSATLWFEDSKFVNCSQSWNSLSNFGFYRFKIN